MGENFDDYARRLSDREVTDALDAVSVFVPGEEQTSENDREVEPEREIERPVIQIVAGELHETATQAEDALYAAEVDIYVRGGTLVRPVVDEVNAIHGRRTKVARLKLVNVDYLTDQLCRVARFERFDGRTKDWMPVNAPQAIAKTILARDGEWSFRPLDGITTTPTMLPDGRLLTQPGYDEATRLLLIDPPPLPAMPASPTRGRHWRIWIGFSTISRSSTARAALSDFRR